VRPIPLAIVAIAIGLGVALAVTAAVLWPRPVSCGSGGGGIANYYNTTAGGNSTVNATDFSVPFPSTAHVGFSWSTPDGSVATFRVIAPNGGIVYSSTGASGSGSFAIGGSSGGSESYGFGIGLAPPNETVDYQYSCTTLS